MAAARSCLPAASTTTTKRHAQRTVRLSKKVRSQARPWILTKTEGFCERRIFARAGLFGSWLLTLPAPSHSGKSLVALCPLKRVCRLECIPVFPTQRHDKLSFPLLFFSFLPFFLKGASARFSNLEACLSRFWFDALAFTHGRGPAPTQILNAASLTSDPCRITGNALPVKCKRNLRSHTYISLHTHINTKNYWK